MYVKQDIGFYELQENCWSGAIDTLNTVQENNKEDELMEFLNRYFEECPDLTEVNDFLWFESDFIFEALGISKSEDEEEEEEIDCKNQKCENCYKYIIGECEGI